MRRLWVALVTLALLAALTPSSVLGAAPGNDNFANATVLTGTSGSIDGTTLEATDEVNELVYLNAWANGVWYSWTNGSRKAVVATFDTCTAATYDTALDVYAGLGSGPPDWGDTSRQLVAGNDDACGLQSTVAFFAAPGTTYWIRVGGWLGITGNFTLAWTTAPTERGTLSVAVTTSRANPGYCTITVKGVNLVPGQYTQILADTDSLFLTTEAGRWTYSVERDGSLWNMDAAGTLSIWPPVYTADGYSEVIPKLVNRCSP